MINAVVAVADNNVIGRRGKIPWKLPTDMRLFRQLTVGGAVIMGRKTWESLPHPLQDRLNIVLTRNPAPKADMVFSPFCRTVHSPEDAIALACLERPNVFIIGGAEIYREMMPQVDVVHLTRVHLKPKGDTRFDFSAYSSMFYERNVVDFPKDKKRLDECPFSVHYFVRRTKPTGGAT